MRMSEIVDLNIDELNDKLKEAKEELFNIRFQHAAGQLDNPMKLNLARRNIARILTIIKRNEMLGDTKELKKEKIRGKK